jgi:hypothetical protein
MLAELETLYRSRLPEFRRVAAGIAGDRELGCDAVQEAFASAVRKRRSFRGHTPPLFGWSFDPRIRSGTATTFSGKHIPLTVVHFGGKVDATFFLIRNRLPGLLREVVLRDAQGRVVAQMRLSR